MKYFILSALLCALPLKAMNHQTVYPQEDSSFDTADETYETKKNQDVDAFTLVDDSQGADRPIQKKRHHRRTKSRSIEGSGEKTKKSSVSQKTNRGASNDDDDNDDLEDVRISGSQDNAVPSTNNDIEVPNHLKNSYLHASIMLNKDINIAKMSEAEVQQKLDEYAQQYQQLMTKNVEIASQLSAVDDKVSAQKTVVRREEEKLRQLEEEERLLKEAQEIQLTNKKIIGNGLKKCVKRLPLEGVSPQLREFADEIPDTDDQQGWVAWAWGGVLSRCTIQ